MRILVTGGAGFIGSHVVDAFIGAGHHVAVVDNLSHGVRENLHPEAVFYEVDICDDVLAEVFINEQPEVICHHAAHISVRYSVVNPIYDAQVNVLGTLNLLECARQAGSRKIVYASSGGAMYGEPETLPCSEEHPVHPSSPYGASKFFVEKYLEIYRSLHQLDYTVLRYANVYGPRQDPTGEGGVVAIFADKMLRGEVPIIYGTGEQARDFVYVADCARANLIALDKGSGRAYNIGSGSCSTINELSQMLRAITGYGGDINYGPGKIGETFRSYLDASRARKELNWHAVVDLQTGLQTTVAYFREQLLAGNKGAA